MVVYNTQWVFGFWLSSGILKLENTTFWKLDLFCPQVSGERPTLLGLLERANLNHWTTNSQRTSL
jgi:hypothetical protein